ncbi:MAG: hypothetical protein ABI411_11090 [Tahibacter sp.]
MTARKSPQTFAPARQPHAAAGLEPRTAFGAWRLGWFWRWQAWRLRNLHVTDSANAVSHFDGFAGLDRMGYADPFLNLQQSLAMSTPGMFADGTQASRRRLVRELTKPAVAVTIEAPDGSLGGHAWARVGTLTEAMSNYQQVQSLGHLRAEDWQAVELRAARICGSLPLLTLHGIGLAPRWRRGFRPLKLLLKPMLDLGLANGAQFALWWTPRGSSLHAVSLGFGARLLHKSSACCLFLLADIRPLAQVFAALPPSAIADLLAQVTPARRHQDASTPRSAAFARAQKKRAREIAA